MELSRCHFLCAEKSCANNFFSIRSLQFLHIKHFIFIKQRYLLNVINSPVYNIFKQYAIIVLRNGGGDEIKRDVINFQKTQSTSEQYCSE